MQRKSAQKASEKYLSFFFTYYKPELVQVKINMLWLLPSILILYNLNMSSQAFTRQFHCEN